MGTDGNKQSTIKMELGNSEDPDKPAKNKSNEIKKSDGNNNKNGKPNGNRRTLNNYCMMADQKTQQSKEKEVSCIICEGKHQVY